MAGRTAVGTGYRVDVRLRGELDLAAAAALEETFRTMLLARPDVVALMLAEVRFVDAAGLRSLESCRRAGERAGVRVLLGRPSAAVRRLLRLTGTSGDWEVESRAAGWLDARGRRAAQSLTPACRYAAGRHGQPEAARRARPHRCRG